MEEMKLRIGRKCESKEEISIPTASAISHIQVYLLFNMTLKLNIFFLSMVFWLVLSGEDISD